MKLGFALIPSSPFFDKIVEIENTYHEGGGFFSNMKLSKNMPHIPLFSGKVKDEFDFVKLTEDLAKEYRNLLKEGIISFESVQYVPKGWYLYICKNTPNLRALHKFVLDRIYDSIILDPKRFSRDVGLNKIQTDSLERYGYRYAGEAFMPFIPIGRALDKNDILLNALNLEFAKIPKMTSIDKIVAFKPGANGTCKRVLYEMFA